MTRQEAAQFYRIHSRALYNTALRILHDSAQAEEVMQDTLLKYISKGVRSETPAQAAAWLRTTCIRRSIDLVRARRKDPVFLALDSEDGSLADESPLEKEDVPDILQIKKAMEELPFPYGLVLDLVLIEGLGYPEVARLTGQKETTLRSIYARGRQKLAGKLKKWRTSL